MAADIVTKQAFLDQVAGRRLIQGDSWVIITPQGTVEAWDPTEILFPVTGSGRTTFIAGPSTSMERICRKICSP